MNADGQSIIAPGLSGFVFSLSTMVILTAATIFTMWLGERITERGIGNGISLIIFIGIVARFPHSIMEEFQLVATGARGLIVEIIIVFLMLLIIAGVVLITQGTRRIPVQYAKRMVGKKVYGGVTQYIPMKIIAAGVMPIIFAQAIMFIPTTIFTFFPEYEFFQRIQGYFNYTSFTYSFIYALLIIFFTYFYTAIVFNPKDIADNMQKARRIYSRYSSRKNT